MSNPEADSDLIEKSLTEKNEKDILDVILKQTHKERLQVAETYKNKYGKDLPTRLEEAGNLLKEDYCNLCSGLFTPKIDYDCKCLKGAIDSKKGVNSDTAIEIIASRKNGTIKKIVEKYKELYNEELPKLVESKIGDVQGKLLVALLQGERVKNDTPNQTECQTWAEKLKEALDKKKKDEALFTDIFVKRSPKELAFISRIYHKLVGKTVLEVIEKNYSGDLQLLLKTLVYAVISPSEYFATRVKKSVKGLGTDDTMLVRVFVTRNEVDIKQMSRYYEKLYKVTMKADVEDDTSGNYQALLLKLIEQAKS